MHDATVNIKNAARDGVENAANWLHHDIMQAFAQNGPGWKKLSQTTIDKKTKEKAPDPEGILKEWNTMRDSIQVRDASVLKTISFLGGSKFTIPQSPTIYGFFGVTGYAPMETIYDVGLFEDYKVMHKYAKSWTPGKWSLVNRGFVHEFGGFELEETEEETHPIKEIITGGIDKRGLKGVSSIDDYLTKKRESAVGKHGEVKIGGPLKIDTGVASRAKEVRQRAIGVHFKKKIQKLKYIPTRSFLRMPYDRSEAVMFWMIAWKINEAINNL